MDLGPCHEAAEMLEFFFGQMRLSNTDMGGNHSYRFQSSGWPMTHCKGPNIEDAVMSVVDELKDYKSSLKETVMYRDQNGNLWERLDWPCDSSDFPAKLVGD